MATLTHHIFVIDDDANILQVTAELLTRHGYRVLTCADSTTALPIIKTETFSAILLDIRMPGIEGTDLLPLIKKVQPDLPVILVSAHASDSNTGHYYALGAFDVVTKPYNHEQLLDTVQRAVEHEERIPFTIRSLSLERNRDLLYQKLMVTALRKTHWNQVKAAQLLGVSRFTLIRWMKKLNVMP